MAQEVVIVCARLTKPLLFADNHTGRCSKCRTKIQFRPTPVAGRKLCLQCADHMFEKDEGTRVKVMFAPNALQDLRRYLRGKLH
jgi:recombinational DNA repair protein (RecF pathway)